MAHDMLEIHHVAIIASDYERSKTFYSQILGLTVVREVFRAERNSWKCDLAASNAEIELFSFPNPPPRLSYPEACGLRHIAFEVENIEDELSRLNSLGVDVESIRTDPCTERRYTFFKDPDGLPIELYEKSRA